MCIHLARFGRTAKLRTHYTIPPAFIGAIAFSFWLGATAGEVIDAPAPVAFDGSGIERGIVRVVCERRNSGSADRVRAVVLDVTNGVPRREVLLAPAHGLPEEAERISKDCRIFYRRGAPARISEYWLPESRGSGTGDDWVVLVTRSKFEGSVGRQRVGQVSRSVLDQLITKEQSVSVMLFTETSDQRDCHLKELLQRMVFSHSCVAWGGLSGSPIIIGVNGEPTVFGMQIGSLTRLTTHQSGPVTSGVALAIDEVIAAAIREAALRASDR